LPDALQGEIWAAAINALNAIPNTNTSDITPYELITKKRPVAHDCEIGQCGIFHDPRKMSKASYGVVMGPDDSGPIPKLRVYFGISGKVLLRGTKFIKTDNVPLDWNWKQKKAPRQFSAFTDLTQDENNPLPPIVETGIPLLPTVTPIVQPRLQNQDPVPYHQLLATHNEEYAAFVEDMEALDDITQVPDPTNPLKVFPEGTLSNVPRLDRPPPKEVKAPKSTNIATPILQLPPTLSNLVLPDEIKPRIVWGNIIPPSHDSKAVPSVSEPILNSKAAPLPTKTEQPNSKAVAKRTRANSIVPPIDSTVKRSSRLASKDPVPYAAINNSKISAKAIQIKSPSLSRSTSPSPAKSPKKVKAPPKFDPDRIPYNQGMNGPHRAMCIAAQIKEFTNIILTNNVFVPILRKNIPDRYQQSISTIFMFFRLKGPMDAFTEAKARLVWGQSPKLDPDASDETHAPTINPLIIQCAYQMAATKRMFTATADFPGAFLLTTVAKDLERYGCIRGPVAKAIVEFHPEFLPFFDERNCCLNVRLNKYLYGTTDAAHFWYEYSVTDIFPDIGFVVTQSDKCLFRQVRPDGTFNFILMHVDDILLLTHTKQEQTDILEFLKNKWKVTTQTGSTFKHLGMIVEHDMATQRIIQHMPTNIAKILAKFPESLTPTKTTPSVPDLFGLNVNKDSPLVECKPYMSALMTILYPARFYRYNDLMTTSVLATAMSKPTQAHMNALYHHIGYIRYTKDYKLELGGDADLAFHISIDAGHGTHIDGRAEACIVVTLGGRVVYMSVWKLKHQTLSSWESEISAASEAGKMAIYLIQLRKDLDLPFQDTPIVLEQDNQSAIHSNNTGIASFKRAKHIHHRNIFITDLIKDGTIVQQYTPSLEMYSDLGTKVHNAERMADLCKLFHLG
jgi:hypothetical protein